MARELRAAVANNEFVLHYQPQARAEDGEICGFEALVRWNHPTRGMIPPLDFIPLAEETGLIGPLGEWVLRQACADAAAWELPRRVAVNLSPLQMHQPNLVTLVHEVLLETGLSAQRLELEVTESALFEDYQSALNVLRRLKALGVRIAMDDFGTGFSSLSTLQSFPFDKIKIDKSFVASINRDARATVIVRAVLGLGRSLEIPVTAEGVETREQLDFLRGEDCAEVQGYAIGHPSALNLMGEWAAPAPAPSAEANVA
jgi:EAL domain-containing protein (putative c-di-GMP-specific phosphodiesterase class I)